MKFNVNFLFFVSFLKVIQVLILPSDIHIAEFTPCAFLTSISIQQRQGKHFSCAGVL